jgi:hypothetical protein
MLYFYPEVMRINLGAELNFFDLVGVLMFACFLIALGQFVTVFAKIHKAANRRDGIGGDFHQIHPGIPREVKRVTERDHAMLVSINANNPDFTGANLPINPDE